MLKINTQKSRSPLQWEILAVFCQCPLSNSCKFQSLLPIFIFHHIYYLCMHIESLRGFWYQSPESVLHCFLLWLLCENVWRCISSLSRHDPQQFACCNHLNVFMNCNDLNALNYSISIWEEPENALNRLHVKQTLTKMGLRKLSKIFQDSIYLQLVVEGCAEILMYMGVVVPAKLNLNIYTGLQNLHDWFHNIKINNTLFHSILWKTFPVS